MTTPIWVFYEGTRTPLQDLCLESIVRINPAARVLDLNGLRELGGEELIRETEGLRWSRRSDLFRYWLLLEYGGIWIDADSIATAPLDLPCEIDELDLLCVRRSLRGRLQAIATPFGARRGSPLVAKLFKRCRQLIRQEKRGRRIGYANTSTGILTGTARRAVNERPETIVVLEPAHYGPVPFFRAKRVFLARGSDAEHENRRCWSRQVRLYHLTNQVYDRTHLGSLSRQELLEGDTFLSFLLRKATIQDRADSKAFEETNAMAKPQANEPIQSAIEPDPELRAAIEECERAEGYLVAAFSYKNGEIRLWRKSSGFPIEDLDTAVDLLDDDLRAERLIAARAEA